jgi:hypothetical protein
VPTATLPIDSNPPEPPTLATVQGPFEVLINSAVDHRALPPPAPAIRRPPPARPQSPDALWDLLHASAGASHATLQLHEALLLGHWIDHPALQRAQRERQRPGAQVPLERVLVEIGALSETDLRMARAEWMGVHVIDPADLVPEPTVLETLSRAWAERSSALPLMLRDDTLVVLLADPWDQALLDELRFVTQHPLFPVMAVPGTLMPALHRAYAAAQSVAAARADDAKSSSVQDLARALMTTPETAQERDSDVVSEADSTLVRLINSVIGEAIARRASDIHIETADAPRQVRIRLRIDGELLPFVELPARLRFAVVARIKIMADLDIAEHRKPQDGKIDFARFGGPHVELRVVTVPTSRGLEDVVLRLLSGLKPRALDDIGLSPDNLARLRVVALRPYGLILICGATGCGPSGHPRTHARRRRDPRPHPAPGTRRGFAAGSARRGNEDAASGRHRQGAGRPDRSVRGHVGDASLGARAADLSLPRAPRFDARPCSESNDRRARRLRWFQTRKSLLGHVTSGALR